MLGHCPKRRSWSISDHDSAQQRHGHQKQNINIIVPSRCDLFAIIHCALRERSTELIACRAAQGPALGPCLSQKITRVNQRVLHSAPLGSTPFYCHQRDARKHAERTNHDPLALGHDQIRCLQAGGISAGVFHKRPDTYFWVHFIGVRPKR